MKVPYSLLPLTVASIDGQVITIENNHIEPVRQDLTFIVSDQFVKTVDMDDLHDNRFMELISLLFDLNFKSSEAYIYSQSLIHYLISNDCIDFEISKSSDENILIYRKTNDGRFKNIIIDDEGSVIYSYIASNPTNSVFKDYAIEYVGDESSFEQLFQLFKA